MQKARAYNIYNENTTVQETNTKEISIIIKKKIMKKMKTIWLLALFVCALYSCESQTEVEVVGDDTERYVGEVDKASTVLTGTEWLLMNTGNATLRVDSIKPSCECLEVMNKEMTARSGKYFPVQVFIHPEEMDTGTFVREVEVYGNFQSSPMVLTIKGRIVNPKP